MIETADVMIFVCSVFVSCPDDGDVGWRVLQRFTPVYICIGVAGFLAGA